MRNVSRRPRREPATSEDVARLAGVSRSVAFVPDSLLQPYVDMLKKQQASGTFTAPAIRQMSATAVTAELHRIYDRKLQGLQLLVNPGAPGSRSPWVTR